jgi:signal transduction histidine kinase/HPt (histidine-containing phosphotransfer) domain-containing protein
MSADGKLEISESRAVLAGRIDILYTLGRHYLSLPFAALCMSATLFASRAPTAYIFLPLFFQITVVIAAEQLLTAYRNRDPDSDPQFWANRYTFVSAVAGATWGVGAWFWFVPDSFAAQAYLTLAFLGMTATEFIARSAHRPAYLAHAFFALTPLVIMLLMQGGLYAIMDAILIVMFVSVLSSYSDGMARLLNESVRLRQTNVNLVERLMQERDDAENARDSAQASAQAKSTFLANISHELRTPLNSLLGMAQILDRAELDHPHREHVKVMLDAGKGLKTLLDDVLTLTQDDDKAGMEDCDPAQAARAIARLVQPRAWEKQLKLNVAAIAGVPMVAADPRRVRQILLKLTDNALKFTDRGSIEIRIESELEGPRPRVRFTVADTGQGVTKEAAARLFEPFSLGDSSYTRKDQGAGLGLAVAKRIVESLGGEIGFESDPGAGAAFWFTLPVSGLAPADSNVIAGVHESRPINGGRFLLFAPETQDKIRSMLEPFGNRIRLARDIQDAIFTASHEEFDAIVLSASETDNVAAAPGVKSPILAIVTRGERAPAGAHEILEWPASASALHAALAILEERAQEAIPTDDHFESKGPLDAAAMSALEKSVGTKTLIEILQAYIQTAEQLCRSLGIASDAQNWEEAARLAQDIAGSAGQLGLVAMTSSARGFASAARDGEPAEGLRARAQDVIAEHVHVRHALENLYPDLAA